MAAAATTAAATAAATIATEAPTANNYIRCNGH